MTAVRNFPNSPLRLRAATPLRWQTPAWTLKVWAALEGYGRRRAARELELLASHRMFHEPELAQQMRRVAAECRNPSPVMGSQIDRSRS